MSWTRNTGGWLYPPGNSVSRGLKGQGVVIMGASQAGGGGVNAEFTVDQAAVLALDPDALSVPSGAQVSEGGVTGTTYTSPKHGPVVGWLSRARLARKASGMRVLTKSVVGSEISTYLSTYFAEAVSEWTAAFGSTPPRVAMYIVSPTDAGGDTKANALPGQLSVLEVKAYQAWGRIPFIVVGTIDSDQPSVALARSNARAWCSAPTGMRAYIDPTPYPAQASNTHLTQLGEYGLGSAAYDVADQGGILP